MLDHGEPPAIPAAHAASPEAILKALQVPQSGQIYDLAVELGHGMPDPPLETFTPFRLSHHHLPHAVYDPANAPAFDHAMDTVTGSTHLGTHIDGLAHIVCQGHMFGGVEPAEAYADWGWRRNGIEHARVFLTRGVLIDVARHHGVESLPDRYEISTADLREALAAQDTVVEPGDVVLVRTGKIREYRAGLSSYFAAQPGVGETAGRWLVDQGVVALGTDTSGSEPHPIADPGRTLHQALLVERGVHLIEIMDLDQLAAAPAYEFLFVCLPLRIKGATGSWTRPIAVC